MKDWSLKKVSALALFYNLGVILWGAFVRISGSGAGCGRHWPLCHGSLLPDFTGPTLVEYIHRVTSFVCLILAVVICFIARRSFPRGTLQRKSAYAVLVFTLLEAAIGAGLVLLELVAFNPSELRLISGSLHLINTLFLLAALICCVELTKLPSRYSFSTDSSLSGLLLLILIASAFGAIAAISGTIYPSQSLAHGIAQDFSPSSSWGLRLRIVHPILGVLTCLYALNLGSSRLNRLSPSDRGCLLCAIATSQLIIGAANLLLIAPTILQLLHLLLADLLWIVSIGMWFKPQEKTNSASAAT